MWGGSQTCQTGSLFPEAVLAQKQPWPWPGPEDPAGGSGLARTAPRELQPASQRCPTTPRSKWQVGPPTGRMWCLLDQAGRLG